MNVQEKMQGLRRYESECYRICMYMLQCETLAVQAAKQALERLLYCDAFFVSNQASKVMRTEAVKASLAVKRGKMMMKL
ncbi:hypothetical protein [Paenibacillus sp. YYML68]|uniref:hypothetical protein n=1 Tax=Paenibacillus sp. YYML68 TaxID=2909250 RepID=UPI0024917AE8|nr:hypothetical protein [Paenibacillus sp. YYML68]